MQKATNDLNDDSDVGIELTPEERAWLAARNVESIQAVPASVWDALPEGQHNRTFALMCAAQGWDVYAYHSAAGWQLWFENERIELSRD